MTEHRILTTLDQARVPSVTDMVFDQLYDRIVSLDLPPGSRLSEADVAKQMAVSRQPVRDAFYRLSQKGFLLIRPQRSTVVAPISVEAVHRARFIRTALELETTRAALQRAGAADLAGLDELIARQQDAVDRDARAEFHALDDAFHARICEIAGQAHAWDVIRDSKVHMDRVRYLSLRNGAPLALADHRRILAGFRARDEAAATGEMRAHLSRIAGIIDGIRAEHREYFGGGAS